MATLRRSRSVIVTGGASGLGKIMSEYFARRGDTVTILDIDGVNGPAVAAELATFCQRHDDSDSSTDDGSGMNDTEKWIEGGSVSFRRCDISSWAEQAAAFKAVYDDVGRVDVVIANAGISEGGRSWIVPPAPGKDASEIELELELEEPKLKILDVNLTGNVYSVKLAMYYMLRNAPDAATGLRGLIICTASNVGMYPFPPAPLYAASKHAIVGLVRSLGPVYAQPHIGIRINALAPAVLETNISGTHGLFKKMVVTPPDTLTSGLWKLLTDTSLTGQVAEIHGNNVTFRPPHDIVDEDSRHNLEEFARFGYGQ
ncbi:15-hydroxyprostaglandin dehydrogenase [Nemania abortiva]|nr:15-hydroxyprostaglandin dehydrogenase [Nemania abortiva]